jgi:hypothetical protein
LAGLLAALVVAGVPGASSAGWASACTAGYRPADAPDGVAAEARASEAGEASWDPVFKLSCHSCGHGGYSNYYAGYSGYYPGYSYYGGYGYYGGYAYYPSYSYYPGVSYYSGCNACSPCGCIPTCGCYSGW